MGGRTLYGRAYMMMMRMNEVSAAFEVGCSRWEAQRGTTAGVVLASIELASEYMRLQVVNRRFAVGLSSSMSSRWRPYSGLSVGSGRQKDDALITAISCRSVLESPELNSRCSCMSSA
jgi:hypothetical protein